MVIVNIMMSESLIIFLLCQLAAAVAWAARVESRLNFNNKEFKRLDTSYTDELAELKNITGNLLEAIHSLEKTVCILNDRHEQRRVKA